MIAALILSIAAEYGLPPQLVLAIAMEESQLVPTARGLNHHNGTEDRGLMQLNSGWYKDANWRDPESNIRAGCRHLLYLVRDNRTDTWWSVLIAWNAGLKRLNNPPSASVAYADRVLAAWWAADKFPTVIAEVRK